ncbi:unnamed protein product [Angiostrongylus costaricensis]|uniref:Ig-like domain-containing protein n=1 Tax=Angiostrongylus costaricensis TaxID=334426 RepID=A0A0R3PPM5_ANGCS|nr:unnamed protein product [Angiostrongylus costaricensis]
MIDVVDLGVYRCYAQLEGRIEFCLKISMIDVVDLGVYRCYAQLEDVLTFKEFQVKRAHEPSLLKSSPNIIFYCQFSIGLFIVVLHVLPFDDDNSNITTTSSIDHEHYHIPVTCCLAEYSWEQTDFNCSTPEYSHLEERRHSPSFHHLDDISQRRVALWRHRIAAMPAPLAQFDKETNIMAIVHTSV